MCIVCTGRVGYRAPGSLDITVKSGIGLGGVLAPSWALVGGVKDWKGYEALTKQEYVERYYDLLRTRYRRDSRPFLEILREQRVILLCYCRTDVFCHRHFAVDILEKIAQASGLAFIRGGELK
jgi:hypothetical protein